MNSSFQREEHLYESNAFETIIRDTIQFFNSSPIVSLSLEERFHGTGVYGIYYTGDLEIYQPIAQKNKGEFSLPIYIGKAVPKGWRQGRFEAKATKKTYELLNRLREHKRSINQVGNLEIEDFFCRVMILEGISSNLIGTVEAALIRHHQPIWNTFIDGFGNHDPGKGRYNQSKSDWDVLHVGRIWAERCIGKAKEFDEVQERVAKYFNRK